MQIFLTFDDRLLNRYKTRNRAPILFGIRWKYESSFYPAQYWEDFGEILLSWWIGVLLKLLEGAKEEEFLFMDGPYSIDLIYERETGIVTMNPKGTVSTWKVPMDQLIEIIKEATSRVVEEFKERKIEGKEALDKCVETLCEFQQRLIRKEEKRDQ